MLLDDALLEDGLVGIGLLVADLDALVLHGANEVVGFGFVGEVVAVGAGALLLDEEGVLQGGVEARSLGDGLDAAAENDAVDGRPALGVAFVAGFAPAAVVDGGPASDEGDRPLEQINPCVAEAQEIVPGEGVGHT